MEMENNTNFEKDERIFDGLLKIAANEVFREEIDALPSDEELIKMFPSVELSEKKGFAVINKEFRVLNRKKALRTFARVAAVFCVFAVFSATILMAYPATRNIILNFLVGVRDDDVDINFGLGATNEENINATGFNFIPEGFLLINQQVFDNMEIYAFENSEEHIIMLQRFFSRSLVAALDNEYADFSTIQLSTGIAYLSAAKYENELSTIVWADGENIVDITTTLDIETLKNLAENYMQR